MVKIILRVDNEPIKMRCVVYSRNNSEIYRKNKEISKKKLAEIAKEHPYASIARVYY